MTRSSETEGISVIFLDFDGCLNHDTFLWQEQKKRRAAGLPTFPKGVENGYMVFQPAVEVLNKIVEATGAVVVISSTWRLSISLEDLKEILRSKGFTGEVIGRTPQGVRQHFSQEVQRGHEIQEWIDEWHGNGGRIRSFVIIDDSEDMAHLMDRLVRINPMAGLVDDHFEPIFDILERGPQR